jgi:predicted RNA-binding protein with PIN domain
MRYLIDGYNLLYAMGVIHGRAGPQGLVKARLRLLGLLQWTFREQAPTLTVVFDAAGAPPGAKEQHEIQGLQVRFAIRAQEADDLIEDLIRHDSAPQQLAVVSDDHRIKDAARHRQCQVLGCLDFLEELSRRRRQQASAPAGEEKSLSTSEEETQCWLKEFGTLDETPEMKELFEPFDFGDDEQEITQ